MTTLLSELIETDSRLARAPVMLRLHQMATLQSVEIIERGGYSQPAERVLLLWSARLWNMRKKRRRFVGLPGLVRNLEKLSANEPVKQVVFRAGAARGLLFYTSLHEKLVGAVISTLTEKDLQRSTENWLKAMGEENPAHGCSHRQRMEAKKPAHSISIEDVGLTSAVRKAAGPRL